MNKRALLQALLAKSNRGLSKRAALGYGGYGAIIGTPTGALLGYKGTQLFTDSKTWKIIGALAGALGGGLTGFGLGDEIESKATYRQARDMIAKGHLADQLRQIDKNQFSSWRQDMRQNITSNGLLRDIKDLLQQQNKDSAK